MSPQVISSSSPPERTSSFYYSRATYGPSHKRRGNAQPQPWEQMAGTFAWVREQQIADMLRQNEETVQWILERQKRHLERKMNKALEDVVFALEREMDAEVWLARARAEEARKSESRAHREEQKRKFYQEELRRLDRLKKAEEHQRNRAKATKGAWASYEATWTTVHSDSNERLSFENIAWPLVSRPRNLNDIKAEGVREFLFSDTHSHTQSNKERLKAALRLWHPDRFQRMMSRVEEKDRRMVEEGVGMVARSLNSLMETVKS